MTGFYSYDAWKTTPPPEDDFDVRDEEEYERHLQQQEQEAYEQGCIDCDERAPWPGDVCDPPEAYGKEPVRYRNLHDGINAKLAEMEKRRG